MKKIEAVDAEIFDNIGIGPTPIAISDIANVIRGGYAVKLGIVESASLEDAATKVMKKIPRSFKGDLAVHISSGKKLKFSVVADVSEQIIGNNNKIGSIYWGSTVSKDLGGRYRISIIAADKDKEKWMKKWTEIIKKQNARSKVKSNSGAS